MMKPEDQTPPGALAFTLRPSAAICEAVAALAEDVQRTREIVRDTIARSLAPFAEGGEVFRAALQAAACIGNAGRLADACAGCAIAASVFSLPPAPEPLHVVLHVHVMLAEGDAPRRVDTTGEESGEWEM